MNAIATLALLLFPSGPNEVDLPIHEEFVRRAEAIAAAAGPSEVLEARQAFLALDRATHSGYLHERARLEGDEELARLAGRIEAMARHLMGRMLVRVASAREGVPFASRLTRPARDEIEVVESAFRAALQANFSVPGGRGEVPFERAFLDYSAGRLRLPGGETFGGSGEVHGGPNGCFHLAFAEAALLFLEEELEPDFWNVLLPTLVKGSALFVETHWNGAGRAREDYRAPREVRAVGDSGAHTEARTAADFERLVAFAFADERMFRLRAGAENASRLSAEAMVKAALFVEDVKKPGTYLLVDLGTPELSGEEVVPLIAALDKSYVPLAENEPDQAGLILEHMKTEAQELPFDGTMEWDAPVNSRQSSTGWDSDFDSVCVPYCPPSGSALDPEAIYFICTWIAY